MTGHDGFEVLHGEDRDVEVPAGGMVASLVALRALRPGRATLRISAEGPDHADAIEHTCEITAAGVPFEIATLAPLGVPTSFGDRVPTGVGPLRAKLVIGVGPTATVDAGLAGLLRRPTGCFEQVSATLYPALLAYRVLHAQGLLATDRAESARRHLLVGYQSAWPRLAVPRGRERSVSVSLRNRGKTDVPCPTVEIRIPAGFAVDRTELEKAARRAGFDRAEIQAGEIHLYLTTLRAGVSEVLTVPVRGHRAGRFRTGAARAYPYYRPEEATVLPDSMVTVTEPEED